MIQGADQHGIVDLETGRIVNDQMRYVELADHVWLGRQSTVMPDVRIGRGSTIATGAVVTKDIPPMAIAAGVPAKVIRTNATWTRNPTVLDAMSREFLQEHRERRKSLCLVSPCGRTPPC
jgi:serine acetyltransferase